MDSDLNGINSFNPPGVVTLEPRSDHAAIKVVRDQTAREAKIATVQAWPRETEPEAKPVRRLTKFGTARASPALGQSGFTDVESMKLKVKEKLEKPPPYCVHIYYHEQGIWQEIARHSWFENCTLFVILVNAFFMFADTDYNSAPTLIQSAPVFQLFEHFFCTYFTLEWVIRFMAFKEKLNGFRDPWFVFDGILVALMVMETWIFLIVQLASGNSNSNPVTKQTQMLRLFRLLRLSRLIRMLRSLPELMILIKGMVTAMKSVLYVMGLLVLITYVFAIALAQLSEGTYSGETYFSSVPTAMLSLTTYCTLQDNLTQFCDDIRADSGFNLFLVLVFIALGFLTVLNMLVGVLCEVVSRVADQEKEDRARDMVIEKFQSIVKELDKDSDGKISYKEFARIMEFPQALKSLQEVGVDPLGVVDFTEQIFFQDGEPQNLDFMRFMELVLDLRGSNGATLKDIKTLWQEINPKMSSNLKDLDDLKDEMKINTERLEKRIAALLDEVRSLATKVAHQQRGKRPTST